MFFRQHGRCSDETISCLRYVLDRVDPDTKQIFALLTDDVIEISVEEIPKILLRSTMSDA